MLHAQSKMLLGGDSEKAGSGSGDSSSSSSNETAGGADLHPPPNSPTMSDEVMAAFDRDKDWPEPVGEAEGTLTTAEGENNDGEDDKQKVESKVPCMINGVANHWSCVECTQTLSCGWHCVFPPHTGGYQQGTHVGIQTPLGQHPIGILVLGLLSVLPKQ